MPLNEADERSAEAINRLVTAFCEEDDFNTAGSDEWVAWMALAWMIRMTRTAEAITCSTATASARRPRRWCAA
jgi:hypothetical protein